MYFLGIEVNKVRMVFFYLSENISLILFLMLVCLELHMQNSNYFESETNNRFDGELPDPNKYTN